MSQILVTPHQSQITLEPAEAPGKIKIMINECPNVYDEELGLIESLDIPLQNIPALIEALKDAYKQSTGEDI